MTTIDWGYSTGHGGDHTCRKATAHAIILHMPCGGSAAVEARHALVVVAPRLPLRIGDEHPALACRAADVCSAFWARVAMIHGHPRAQAGKVKFVPAHRRAGRAEVRIREPAEADRARLLCWRRWLLVLGRHSPRWLLLPLTRALAKQVLRYERVGGSSSAAEAARSHYFDQR